MSICTTWGVCQNSNLILTLLHISGDEKKEILKRFDVAEGESFALKEVGSEALDGTFR